MADQPSPWQRFKDNFIRAAVHSPLGGGGIARAYYKHEGYSDEQINKAIKSLDADFDKKYKNAPVFQGHRDLKSVVTGDNKPHGLDYVSPENIGRGVTSLLGSLLGGVDPTYAVAPGASAAERIPAQMAVQGASSAARQKVNVNTGMQDKVHPEEVLTDMAMGGLFQTGMEGLGAAGRSAEGSIAPPDVIHPDDLGDVNMVQHEQPPVEAQADANSRLAPPDELAPEHINDALAPQEAPVSREDAIADFLKRSEPAPPPEGARQHKNFTEVKTDAQGNTHLNYKASSGETLPIKMGIEPDGTAEIAINQFSDKAANSLGPKEIRSAMYDLMDMYPEIKRFGGFRRSGAGAGRVQEIEPVRPAAPADDSFNRPASPKEDQLEQTIVELDDVIAHGGPEADRAAAYQDRLMEQSRQLREERRVQTNNNSPETPLETAQREALQAEDEFNNHVGWGDEIPDDNHPMYANRNSTRHKEWDTKRTELEAKKEAASEKYSRLIKDGQVEVPDHLTDEHLTSAERQEMDASADKPNVDETYGETPYTAPNAPANDVSRGDAAKNFVQNILTDERGSLGGDNDNYHDIADARQKKALRDFAQSLRDKIGDRVQVAKELAKKAREEGLLPFNVGDRFITPKGRELNQGPWKVTGHYVDPKDPERYGYYVERGTEGGDLERSQMLVSDPKADARRAERGWEPYDRAADVSQWKKLGGPRKSLLDDESGSFRLPDWFYKKKEAPEEADPVVSKLIEAIKKAEPVRSSQEKLYTKERGARISDAIKTSKFTAGEAGFYAEKKKLGGDMPKATYESVRDEFSQPEIDSLFDMVKNNNRLTFFDKINARTALSKLLGADGTAVPTKSELKLLHEVFPEELTSALTRNPFRSKLGQHIANALNIPRSLMASMDFSAPGRQGIFLIGSKAYWTSFVDMFKAFGSEKAYQAIAENITSRPTYILMRKSGLALSNTGKKLSDREEAFMSQWAEKIPLAGRLVRASDRAYSGYLNKLRADTFDNLVRDSKAAGIDFGDNPKALKDIARFVNAATGRGDLGKLNQAAPVLAGMFFSPRLMASRVQLLNPVFYARLSPPVRKQALKSLLAFSGLALTTLSLAKAGGLDVDFDPRSTDFGKIRFGNTRYDILGGFQQYLRAGGQLISGQKVNPDTREVTELGKGYKADTRLDVVEKFFENKFSPLASFAADLLRGKDAVGQPLDAKSMVAQRFVPLLAQDMYDVYKDSGGKGVAASIVPATFGIGVQTYQPRPPKKSSGSEFDNEFGSDEFSKANDFESEF